MFAADPAARAQVTIEALRAELARAAITTDQPVTVVFSEADYPGWQTRLDGALVKLGRFENTFLALEVPAGTHQVEWTFQSRSFQGGLALSLAALLGLLGAGLGPAIRAKRSR